MARLVFGDAIDYARVRLHNRCYLPFGLQPANCAMAPNGSIYFHPSCYLPNYAAADARARHWFMHEMTFLWRFAHRVARGGPRTTCCTID